MVERENTATPLPAAPSKRRQMPREAIRAIAYCGYLFGASTAFLSYYALKGPFHPAFFWLNAVTTVMLFAGSWWMLRQLKRA